MIPSLNYAVLTDALRALKEDNIHHRESLGLTFDEMNIPSGQHWCFNEKTKFQCRIQT